MAEPTLLGVPNVSEGRDLRVIERLARAFAAGAATARVRLLDVHSDPDHDRSVFTLAGAPLELLDAMLAGAAETVRAVQVREAAGGSRAHARRVPQPATARAGQHPHVGALDVAPVVYLRSEDRGAACAAALVLADRLGSELELPVFLYGELTASDARPARTRAELRRGALTALAARMRDPEHPLRPDFGPSRPHPSAGATLVAAREPLVAFNLVLAPAATREQARAVAAAIREGGGGHGLPGLRAIVVTLHSRGGRQQISMNVERPLELPLAEVVAAVRRLVPVASAEIVGLAPRAALEGFPEDVPLVGFDPGSRLIENALGCL